MVIATTVWGLLLLEYVGMLVALAWLLTRGRLLPVAPPVATTV